MAFELLEIKFDAFSQIDLDRVRIQGRDPVDRSLHLSDLEPAMPDLPNLVRRPDDPLGKKKTGSKFTVLARRPHRDRNRLVLSIRKPKPYLKRFLDGKHVVGLFMLNT